MANNFQVVVQVPDRSYQALAKIEIKELASQIGFKGHRMGELEIIASEIITNLVKHTLHGGRILCRILDEEDHKNGLELIAIDDGPGIPSTRKMIQDGLSTSSTLGHGLGAIQRLSDEFDIYSLKGWGTILLSRIYLKKKAVKKTEGLALEILRTTKPGEKVCGDNWIFLLKNKQYRLAVIDGLGHGEQASIAANQAIESMKEHLLLPPNELLREVHNDIRKSRGVVMSVAYIDPLNKQLTYCGVGNISCKLANQTVTMHGRSFNSYNGIVGHTMPSTINSHIHPWDKYDILVMHSDGISARWDLSNYPNILKHHTMILCAAIYKDHTRGNDDSTIAILRFSKSLS